MANMVTTITSDGNTISVSLVPFSAVRDFRPGDKPCYPQTLIVHAQMCPEVSVELSQMLYPQLKDSLN